MAAFTITAAVLGLTEREYDFKNQANERIAGIARTLHLWDFLGRQYLTIKVTDEYLAVVKTLSEGDLIAAPVNVSARDNKTSTTLAGVPSIVGTAFERTGEAPAKAS